jgi:FkbM family methyltransferase
MDLLFNTNPRFTKWLIKSGTLQERFVLIDVGVQGGENPRWHFFGDHLVVHGFDAIEEVVDDLSRKHATSRNKFYHWIAIGNEDGARQFFFNPKNRTGSSFYEVVDPEIQQQARTVPIRRLDSLLKEGVIPKADFLKVDVEGHERDVFWGASELLAAGLIGVEAEASFGSSIIYPRSQFDLIHGLLIEHGLVVADLNFNRVRRAAYLKARSRRNLRELPVEGAGMPSTLNVLFCRDPPAEGTGIRYYEKPPSPLRIDQILKLMAIYELHDLNDVAVDIAVSFSNQLGQRLDVEHAIDLLCERTTHDFAAVKRASADSIEGQFELARDYVLQLETDRTALMERLDQIYASTSWRLTAPLRAIGNILKRRRAE